MAALQITITDAGRAEIINAANTGTAPVEITEVGLGTGQYTPDPAQTALTNEVKRLNTISGEVVADDTIHVTVKDEGSDAYDVAEFGLFTASGTLFAVYSQASGPFMQKAAQSSLLLSVDVILGTLDATNLTFGDTSFSNPPASETVAGVVELATADEVQAGADNSRAVTPAGLASRTATETRAGIVELATADEVQALASTTLALTPARLADAFKGANQSLSGNGYQKLPGGLIMQWGRKATGNIVVNYYGSTTFPFTFPNNIFQVNATLYSYAGRAFDASVAVTGHSLTGFNFTIQEWAGIDQNLEVSYIAIGD